MAKRKKRLAKNDSWKGKGHFTGEDWVEELDVFLAARNPNISYPPADLDNLLLPFRHDLLHRLKPSDILNVVELSNSLKDLTIQKPSDTDLDYELKDGMGGVNLSLVITLASFNIKLPVEYLRGAVEQIIRGIEDSAKKRTQRTEAGLEKLATDMLNVDVLVRQLHRVKGVNTITLTGSCHAAAIKYLKFAKNHRAVAKVAQKYDLELMIRLHKLAKNLGKGPKRKSKNARSLHRAVAYTKPSLPPPMSQLANGASPVII